MQRGRRGCGRRGCDAQLDEGWNVFVILVRDEQGLTAIKSVNVWHDPDGEVASNPTDPPLGG